MRFIKIIISVIILLSMNSCVTGIYELFRGFEHYIETNSYGREELKKMKFKDKFEKKMSEKINCNDVYYRYYESENIDLKIHSYLIFFETGQYAYYNSKIKKLNIENLEKASFIGYYIVKDNKIILEKPNKSFNNRYRVLWKFEINNNILKNFSSPKHDFSIDKKISFNREEKPNW